MRLRLLYFLEWRGRVVGRSREVAGEDPDQVSSSRPATGKARQGKAILNHTTGQTPALQCDCAPYAGMEVGVDGEMKVCMDR